MVKFVRIRGRIVPIIQKAVAKGSGYFGRAGKMADHEKNIKALQAVRKSIQGKAKHIHDGGVETAAIFSYKNKVIKHLNSRFDGPMGREGRLKIRHAAEVSLSRAGLAPDTHFIQTSKKNYLVSDKVKITAGSLYEKLSSKLKDPMDNHKISKVIGDEIEKTTLIAEKRFGIDRVDGHWENFGFNGKKAKILDAGNISFSAWRSPGTYPLRSGFGMANNMGGKSLRYSNEYRALLGARSKIIRKPAVKESLRSEDWDKLKALDKFNLLGKKK